MAVVQPLQTLLAPLQPTPRAKKDGVSAFTELFTLSALPTLSVLIFNSKGVRHSAFAKPYLLRKKLRAERDGVPYATLHPSYRKYSLNTGRAMDGRKPNPGLNLT